MLSIKSYDIIFESIKNNCIIEEFKKNIFCQDSWLGKSPSSSKTLKIITNFDTFLKFEQSYTKILEKCFQDQSGVLKDKGVFKDCIKREKENKSFGKIISKFYDRLGDRIHMGGSTQLAH